MKAGLKDQFEKVRRSVTKAEVEGLVKSLVRIPSHSDVPTREKAIAEFLNEFLSDEGLDSKLRYVEKSRPNVIAVLKGEGGGKRLMLNGHTDTVPAYDMDIPPFAPSVKEGRLYGRGALDMKGGLGSMALALVALRRAKTPLVGDVILTAVVGEELRSEGTEDIVLRGPSADMAIVGEPTNMSIQPSHRGLEWLEVHVHGRAAHGGLPDQGVNAISKAAKFINLLETDLMPRIRTRKSRHTLPPTLNLGVISGGQQPSSVADHCVIKIDRRWIPEEDLRQVFHEIHDLFDRLTAEDPDFKATLKRDPANMKSMTHVPNVVRRDHRIVRVLEESVQEVTGKRPPITSFWGWTDAALLTNFAKTPTVVFGPGGEGAHARVEYVLTNDLVECTRIYARAAMGVCGPPRYD